MTEFIVLDSDRPFKQEAWIEAKDSKGRITRPAQPARDEMEIALRIDKQFRALVRLPKAVAIGAGRRGAITSVCSELGLGEELASGVRIVEVEVRHSPAREAMVTPERLDEQGNVSEPEVFVPAQAERIEYFFVLRLQERDLLKLSMTEEEVSRPGWKRILLDRAPFQEAFEV